MRHHRIDLDRTHALADRALHAQEPDAVLVLHELADRPDAPVAEMIDVVDLAAAVLEFDQDFEDRKDVLLPQRADRILGLEAKPRVHLDAADGREVVALGIEEQAVEQGLRGLERRRLARAHDAVDVDERILARRVLVDEERVADIGGRVHLVERERRDLGDLRFLDDLEKLRRDLVASLGEDFAGMLVDDVDGEKAPDEVLLADLDLLQSLLGELSRAARRKFFAGLGAHLAGLCVDEIVRELLAMVARRIERRLPAGLGADEVQIRVEIGEDFLLRHALRFVRLKLLAVAAALGAQLFRRRAVERVKQGRHRQLAAAVDADIKVILGIELEIEPRAAIGNDAGGEEILARGMRLALVVIEEHAGRAVHLRDDDALRAVDDEGAVLRHERHVAHVDILLLDVLELARPGVLVHIEHDEAQRHLERRGIRDSALLALLDVVFRLFELVAHELEPRAVREVADRKDRFEDLLQSYGAAALGRAVHLQEVIV